MLKFTAGVTKGNIEAGYVFNDPFRLGKVDPNYTSSRVVTNYTITTDNADTTKKFVFNWKPVIEGTVVFNVTKAGGTAEQYVVATVDGEQKLVKVPEGGKIVRRTVMVQPTDASTFGDVRLEGVESRVETVVFNTDGTTPADATSDTVVLTGDEQYVEFQTAFSDGDKVEFAYTY